VVIHAGTVQVIDWIFDAGWLDAELGKSGCFKEYSSYLGRQIERNQTRVANSLNPNAVAPPIIFARSSEANDCAGVTTQQFLASPGLGERKARAIEASIMFLYLHELGHHVLEHTRGKRTADLAGLAMSRSQEDAADRFAISTGLRAGYSLVPAMPWHALMAMFGGDSIEAERKSTHPLGIGRVLRIYEETLRFYQQSPSRWPNPATYSAGMQELTKEISRLRPLVESMN
jgi:hypothetical protein